MFKQTNNTCILNNASTIFKAIRSPLCYFLRFHLLVH